MRIDKEDNTILIAESIAERTACSNLVKDGILEDSSVYGTYTASKDFIEKLKDDDPDRLFDCLRNAERIMSVLKKKTIDDITGINSCTVEGLHVIGDTNAQNIISVNNVPDYYSNAHAHPLVGHAYFICRTDNIVTEYPYHAAAVICKNSEHTITLETNGDTVEWFFGRYTSGPDNGVATFHDDFIFHNFQPGFTFRTVAIKLINTWG